MVFLALAMLGAIFLISAVVFGVLTAAVAVLDIGVLFAWFWYEQPLRRQRHGSSPKGSRGLAALIHRSAWNARSRKFRIAPILCGRVLM